MLNSTIISIVIPCRNEEKYIGLCLDSLIENDFDHNQLELIVVDGMSVDGTQNIVKKYVNKYPFIKLLENPRGVTPAAMNLGIRKASGSYIMILSSHSKVDPTFIRKNIVSLKKYKTDCVGGSMLTLPANNSLCCRAIALAMSHPFGVGNSYFRIGAKSERYVDTVPFGCYKKETFRKIGFFDEDLIRNQDDEFNLRLIRNSGKILLVPEIVSYYYARDSLLKLWRMFYQYGYFKPLVAKKVGGVLTWRQLIPSGLVSSLVILGGLSLAAEFFFWIFLSILALYLISNLALSLIIAQKKNISYFVILPVVFATLHFSYGTGYIKGIWDFVITRKNSKDKVGDMPLTR